MRAQVDRLLSAYKPGGRKTKALIQSDIKAARYMMKRMLKKRGLNLAKVTKEELERVEIQVREDYFFETWQSSLKWEDGDIVSLQSSGSMARPRVKRYQRSNLLRVRRFL